MPCGVKILLRMTIIVVQFQIFTYIIQVQIIIIIIIIFLNLFPYCYKESDIINKVVCLGKQRIENSMGADLRSQGL